MSCVTRSALRAKNNRRWKFESYQKGQRAVNKLAADILEGVEDKNDVVVAWGDGSFGPTSKGHASAPNKGLMKSLSRFMPIVIVDEYGTTKNSCCCFAETTDMKTSSYKETGRRATVLQCKECKTVLSRDVSAAVNIIEAFIYMNANASRTNQFRPRS